MVISHNINEKKMGYYKSKSELNLVSIKEQQVDSSWYINKKIYFGYK